MADGVRIESRLRRDLPHPSRPDRTAVRQQCDLKLAFETSEIMTDDTTLLVLKGNLSLL